MKIKDNLRVYTFDVKKLKELHDLMKLTKESREELKLLLEIHKGNVRKIVEIIMENTFEFGFCFRVGTHNLVE